MEKAGSPRRGRPRARDAAVSALPALAIAPRPPFSVPPEHSLIVDAAHVHALERQGYLVESSVAPLFYETHKGGPEFVEAPLRPYFLAYDSATRPDPSRQNAIASPATVSDSRRSASTPGQIAATASCQLCASSEPTPGKCASAT